MEKKFIAAVMVAALFLSGCNLNTGTTTSPASQGNDVMMAKETPPAPTPSTPSIPSEPEAMDAMEKDDDAMVEPVMEKTVSYKAGAIQAFDQKAFDAAVADGKTVFLDFYASWCPTCRANEPIVDGAFGGTDVVGFRVDYDTATALKKAYSVVSQSTYLVLKGGEVVSKHLGALTSGKMTELLGS